MNFELSRKIKSLKGIEFFSNLTDLSCAGTEIEELDLRNFNKLTYLSCGGNSLKKIQFNNTLERLSITDCSESFEVVIPDNPKLTHIFFEHLKLKEFNFNKFVKLEKVVVNNCSLTSLELDKCTELNYLDCRNNWKYTDCLNVISSLNLQQNSKLTYVDTCKNENLTTLILPSNSRLDFLWCASCKLNRLDLSNQSMLTSIDCSNNALTELSLNGCKELTTLSCKGNEIIKLDIQEAVNVEKIDCSANQLTSLDLSHNSKLKEIKCENQHYSIELNKFGVFDLNTLPAQFKLEKASNWQYGTVSGNLLKIQPSTPLYVNYTYDCGNGINIVFTIYHNQVYAYKENTIIFDANGGSGFMSDIIAKGSFSLPNNLFTAPEGKVFSHWDVNGVAYNAGELIPVTDDFIVKAMWGIVGKDVDYRIIQGSLNALSIELQHVYHGLSEVKNALLNAISSKTHSGQLKTIYYDIRILVKRDGTHWENIGAENIPEGGVRIKLPYPQGTGKTGYRFYVSHMFGHTSNRLGIKTGAIEAGVLQSPRV